MGDFGVRQSNEWEWVESQVGVAGFGREGERLNLGQTLSWSGIDSPVEETEESVDKRPKFWSG